MSDWRVWARIGFLSFGGPAGQIALMHRELVDQRGWVDEARFLQALNVCMLLPGPEAMQLATWIGWIRGGWRGGLVAGLWFVMPGALAILALSLIYVLAGQVGWIEGAFDAVLEPGMTLCVEALISPEGGDFSVKLEDQVLITDTGCETLTRYPFDAALRG